MTDLFVDWETYNSVPLKDGTYKYTSSAKIIIAAWALDDGPINVEDVSDNLHWPFAKRASPELIGYLRDPAITKVAHNSMFDRTVARSNGVEVPIEQWVDTMVQALCHGLPGGLDTLCEIMKVPVELAKKKEGKQFIQLFCKPYKDRRCTRKTHPIEWGRFLEYAGNDISSMRVLRKKLPRWNYPDGPELDRWRLDQKINDRGFAVDLELAAQCVRACDAAKKRHADRTAELTADEVDRTTQRDRLLKHILEVYGVDLPDTQKSTLETRLNDQDLPWQVRELISIRLMASQASVAKYKTVLRAANEDGRARGALQFSGAQRTGRWAGRVIQPQNLPRPSMKVKDIEQFIEAVKSECEDMVYE